MLPALLWAICRGAKVQVKVLITSTQGSRRLFVSSWNVTEGSCQGIMQEFSILIISAVDFEGNYKVEDLVTNDI